MPGTPGANPNPPGGTNPQTPATTPAAPQQSTQQQTQTPPTFASKDESNFQVIPKVPVTPEQITGFYNQPLVIPQIPPFKFEAIKPVKSKNKTISSYLKSIEAKMATTEKLLKNLLKLQNLQITQERILNERRRELYSDTFQEYLLDKTVEFKNKDNGPDDGDCTCINLPKTPPRPPSFPSTTPTPKGNPQRNPQNQNKQQPATDTVPKTKQVPQPKQQPIPTPTPKPGGWNWPQIPVFPPVKIPDFEGIPSFGFNKKSPEEEWLTTGKYPTPKANPLVSAFDKGLTKLGSSVNDIATSPLSLLLGGPGFGVATSKVVPGLVSRYLPKLFPKAAQTGVKPASMIPPVPPAINQVEQLSLPIQGATASTTAKSNIVPFSRQAPKLESVNPSVRQLTTSEAIRNEGRRLLLIKKIKDTGYSSKNLKNYTIDELQDLFNSITKSSSTTSPISIEKTITGGTKPTSEQLQILNTPISGPTPPTNLKASGGIQDVQLHDASSMNFFRHMSGTGNFASGGLIDMAMNFIKGILPTPKKPKGLRGTPLKRIMHGTKTGVPELIRSGGFKGQTGMLGKGVYGSVKGWVADTYRGAGAFKGILPGQGPRLDLLVPQAAKTLRGATVVTERQANRGLSIAEGILSGKYTGAKAQSLLPLLVKETPTMGQAFLRSLTPLLKMGSKVLPLLNAPVIGDALFPEPTQQYDQLTGPYAAYNNPTLSKKQAADMRAAMLETGQNNLSMTTQKTTAPSVIPLPPIDMRIPVKKPPKRDESMLPPEGVDIPNSNVSFINRRTSGASWSSNF